MSNPMEIGRYLPTNDPNLETMVSNIRFEEPLPADNELWSLPNVIVSPHLGGLNTSYPESILPLLVQNLELFLAGRYAEMVNIVSGA